MSRRIVTLFVATLFTVISCGAEPLDESLDIQVAMDRAEQGLIPVTDFNGREFYLPEGAKFCRDTVTSPQPGYTWVPAPEIEGFVEAPVSGVINGIGSGYGQHFHVNLAAGSSCTCNCSSGEGGCSPTKLKDECACLMTSCSSCDKE